MSRNKISVIKILLSVIICLIIVVCLNTTVENYEIIAKYSEPICVVDLHKFTSDKCEECEESIQKVGIFYNLDGYEIEDELSRLKFSEYFESYNDYIKLRNKVFVLSILYIISLGFIISFIVEFILILRRRGNR